MYESATSPAATPVAYAIPPTQGTQVAPPAFVLFDLPSIGLATVFGSPAAGALLMAVNYRRLGQGARATLTLVLGIVVSAMAVLIGYELPTGGSSTIGIALLIATTFVARQLQGKIIEQHKALGGKLGSKGVAFGVGASFLVVIVAAVAIPAYMTSSSSSKVIIGTKDEVFYNGSATKQEAQALGAALQKINYFQDKGTSVILDKGANGTTVSLVQKEGVWDEPEMLANSEEVVRLVAYSIGGLPVHVKLINSQEEVKKTGMIGRVVAGSKDEVYFEGTATESDANALGQALLNDKYFQGRGTTVLISKDGRGTVLEYVVADGVWNNAASVAAFESVTREVAPSVGGLPIKMRLVNTTMDSQREVLVN